MRWQTALGEWHIDAIYEGWLPMVPELTYPRCIDGERAGIPQDMGPEELCQFVQALADQSDPDHEAAVCRER
jgi:hypothetical protein